MSYCPHCTQLSKKIEQLEERIRLDDIWLRGIAADANTKPSPGPMGSREAHDKENEYL